MSNSHNSEESEAGQITPVLGNLLVTFANRYAPNPVASRNEKGFISISEIMSYLNTSAGRIDPESHFDAEAVIQWLTEEGYRQEPMGGVLHFVYY